MLLTEQFLPHRESNCIEGRGRGQRGMKVN